MSTNESLLGCAEAGPSDSASTRDPEGEASREAANRRRGFWVFFSGVLACLITWVMWTLHPIGIAFDPNADKCLPNLHLALLVRGHTTNLHDGDFVYWKPAGPLAYVKQDWVLKEVGAVPGDHLQIVGDRILVNGHELTHGLALVHVYHTSLAALQRDEIVPAGKLFLVGFHPRSDDSRYWGYLDQRTLVGRAIKIR